MLLCLEHDLMVDAWRATSLQLGFVFPPFALPPTVRSSAQTKEPKDALSSAYQNGRNFGRNTFGFQTIFLLSAERRCFCRKRVFWKKQSVLAMFRLQKEVFWLQKEPLLAEKPLSVLSVFLQKLSLFETPSLSAIGMKRKILVRLTLVRRDSQ